MDFFKNKELLQCIVSSKRVFLYYKQITDGLTSDIISSEAFYEGREHILSHIKENYGDEKIVYCGY